ncbi:MAG: biotin/lipoyl-binding protein [Anaerolineae bacterium]|nr:biotin/lipoyl-binding protein [Anaerolineae bacterium]MBN8619500.1 biotin/lipoyl-binding protein [Anaerolineae bacterium]
MKYVTTVNNHKYEIEILADGSVLVNGKPRVVDFTPLGRTSYSILSEGKSQSMTIEERDGNIELLMRGGRMYTSQVMDERALLMAQRSGALAADSGEIKIKSPMPGLIVAVKVEAGQEVKAGETVVILESMKMQNELKAPRDGVIGAVNVAGGQAVEQNKVLITIT